MIHFTLPQELIAQEPARPRDAARLLVYDRKNKVITDSIFRSLPDFLPASTMLVVNNSKVEHCRWLFDDGKTELFIIEKLDTHTVRVLVRPGKKFKLNAVVSLTEWLQVSVTAIDSDGIRTLKLSVAHDDSRLHAIEHVPLPPYIQQNDALAEEYQTIYAKPLGSKAAPTAGLHFTEELLDKIRKQHDVSEVTLHVGLGTFAGLSEENFNTGRLHEEYYEISPEVAKKLITVPHVTAVGTTSARTLESWAGQGSSLTQGLSGDTDIFIQPGYGFKRVNSLITNFHLPNTSLLLMIEAFVGSAEETQRIYDHAIAEKYRFYSFGDAMLIL
jgi:S-adenosylmethionine:tRNA ribosyltransferase-isomerase